MRRRRSVAAAVATALLACLAPVPAASASDSFAVGDSIVLGAKAQLQAAGYRVDAVVGRTFEEGLQVIRSQAGSLPPRMFVHLGTNSGVTSAQCRELVSLVGPSRTLTMATIHIPASRPVTDASNKVLADCASAPNVTLVDWAGHVRANPGVVCPDGIHISCGGAGAYASFVLAGSPAPQPASNPPADRGGTPAARSVAPGAGAAPQGDAASVRARADAERTAAQQAAAAAAAAREAARAAAEAARIAAELQRRLERLQSIGVQDLEEVERQVSPSSYRFVGVAERLCGPLASS